MDFQKLLDASVLCACSTWLAMHRILLERGFVIGRTTISTDTLASLMIGLASCSWTYANYLNAVQDTDQSTTRLIGSMSTSPLLVQTLFLFWVVSYIDGVRVEKIAGASPYFWSLRTVNGPFDWSTGLQFNAYLALCSFTTLAVCIPSFAAISLGDIYPAIFNLVGLIIYLLNGVPENPYVNAPHRYGEMRLRLALPTDHHEGTVYLLPSARRGMDAVWSPKIANEHLEADAEIMTLFRHMRSRRWSLAEPLQRLRVTLAAYQRRAVISNEHIARLARFIYLESSAGEEIMRKIACLRANNVHLIGRDLMFALCHIEYLVFMGQGRLPRSLQDKLGQLRLMSRSGASNGSEEPIHTVGFSPGMEGYREAAKYVYKIFGEEVDRSAIDFTGTNPPRFSDALSRSPNDIDDYVSSLWDICCEYNESTFTALYMFTTVWFMELGNVNGFHIFPLRCRTRNGDRMSQQIVWRQVWYAGVIAQLVSVSPVFFASYVSGLFL